MSAIPQCGMSAFPTGPASSIHGVSGGLTIRDWFAGKALQGKMVNPKSGLFDEDSITFTDLAEDCYRIADAMLAARSEGGIQ